MGVRDAPESANGNRILDLGKGQADIAIRASLPTDNSLFGRKIGEISWALYAGKSYVDRYGSIGSLEDIDRHAIVLFDGELSNHPASVWLKSVAPNAKVVARSRNLPTLLLAVQSGAGIAPMPTTVENRDLIRLFGPIPELSRPLHLLIHKDMRSTPRIRAFYEFMIQEVREIRALLIAEHKSVGAEIERLDPI
jgi:DNA-binding transcriptional LysR family regulator